jgi:hypothetical protein
MNFRSSSIACPISSLWTMSPAFRDSSTMSRARVSIRLAPVDPSSREIVRADDPRPQRVVQVVVDVRDPIDEPHHPALERQGLLRPRVVEDPVAHRLRKVEPPPVALQYVHHPKGLTVVPEAPSGALAERRIQGLLANVPERRVAEVVAQPDRLGEVLVQLQRPRHGSRDPARLERVRKPRLVVVTLRCDEHLGLVLEPPERLRVHDPIAIALEGSSDRAVRLRLAPDRRVRRRRLLPQVLPLPGAHPVLEGAGGDGRRLTRDGGQLEKENRVSRCPKPR